MEAPRGWIMRARRIEIVLATMKKGLVTKRLESTDKSV